MAAEILDSSNGVLSETFEACKVSNVSVDLDLKMGPISTEGDLGSLEEEGQKRNSFRAEIDTSAPFGSVKEAVSRFGGIGFWKPISGNPHYQHDFKVVDVAKVEEEAAQLQKDLIVKERETFDVLKKLETTKRTVEELKSKLERESSGVCAVLNMNSDDGNVNNGAEVAEKEGHEYLVHGHQNSADGVDLCPSSAPAFILVELEQAKLNLTKSTDELANIQAIVESYNKKIEKERLSLEKTQLRLCSNSSKIVALEEELNQTTLKVKLAKHAGGEDQIDDPMDISREIQRLSSETEQFQNMGETSKSEVLRAMSEIERMKNRIKTAEIRLIAARKMKEAARASEAVALTEIKAISYSENSAVVLQQKPDSVTLSFEEYSFLTAKAREAEAVSEKRVLDAMLQVDEANASKIEILQKVDEVAEEVKISKKALEEAFTRVEAANIGKLAVEEALRRWRAERGQKRRAVHNSAKFKNSCPTHSRRESRVLDVNGLNLITDESKPVRRSTMSIGQILSRKLLLEEEYDYGMQKGKGRGKRKVSLAQMLSKSNSDLLSNGKGDGDVGPKQLSAKRKKFGFARISILVSKQIKRKKKQALTSGCYSV